jgi:hypothetical protein
MGSIYLIDQDLKDIGVLLGHRPKMLRAIGEVAVAAAPSPERAPAAEPKPHDTAERRQVTVMLSDLAGGFVAKHTGDGVLVYFGYPQAHEDDAKRAVRAGLELVSAWVL